jgi:hypothetical protein
VIPEWVKQREITVPKKRKTPGETVKMKNEKKDADE